MSDFDTRLLSAKQREMCVEQLQSPQRRERQEAAHVLMLMARKDPAFLLADVEALVSALSVGEARTRWECLEALSLVAAVDAAVVEGALDGAEEALFDEGSSTLRVAAFRFLVTYGASDSRRSVAVWPIIDEAIQCYHGDPEYRDLLVALRDFAAGAIDETVRDAFVSRLKYDVKHGRGVVRAYSREISDHLLERSV